MRRIQEFKSYRSAIDYDAKTGQFIITPLRDVFSAQEAEETQLPGAEIVPFPRYFLPRKAVIRRLRDAHRRHGSQARLEYEATGLPAWKRGQSGQVGNEAAPTVATSAGVRLVNPTLET